MAILVTGVAGFIGFHVAKALLQQGEKVIGIDNLSPYYDVTLKKARLENLSGDHTFYLADVADKAALQGIVAAHQDIDRVVHLAAQAGVRYSLENPYSYVETNLMGWVTVLEACKSLALRHFVYASSSSVYGSNTKMPFSIKDRVDHPMSLYAATKRANELIAEAYAHLYAVPLTGLRFFTVYGPWGRPDMSAFIFTKALFEGQTLKLFNKGDMRRNFTYIDDIVAGVLACLEKPAKGHKIYNLGNNASASLIEFVRILEKLTGKEAKMDLTPIQPGDVPETLADITESTNDFGFIPTTHVEKGLAHFVDWYKDFYRV